MIEQSKVREGESILQEYKNGKTALEKRVIANEQWYKMRHWEQIRRKDNGPQTASAWLFNSLANKHADAMSLPVVPRAVLQNTFPGIFTSGPS